MISPKPPFFLCFGLSFSTSFISVPSHSKAMTLLAASSPQDNQLWTIPDLSLYQPLPPSRFPLLQVWMSYWRRRRRENKHGPTVCTQGCVTAFCKHLITAIFQFFIMAISVLDDCIRPNVHCKYVHSRLVVFAIAIKVC